MGGYVTTYNQPAGEKSSFLFVTVRGAGHMVPRYRAEEAQMLINKFFAGEVLPGYTAPPRRPHRDDEL
jgi:carboxypeptidase C (cathepsin A)